MATKGHNEIVSKFNEGQTQAVRAVEMGRAGGKARVSSRPGAVAAPSAAIAPVTPAPAPAARSRAPRCNAIRGAARRCSIAMLDGL